MKKNKNCLFAGSFDPFTNGHLYILKNAVNLFDKVYVVVTENLSKTPKISADFRFLLAKQAIKRHKFLNVEVLINKNELTSLVAKKLDCQYLIRGIKNIVEFETEKIISKNNSFINKNLTTIFFIVPEPYCYISSSVFWEIYFYKKELVEKYVDKETFLAIFEYLKKEKRA